ncbi:MAG: serine/threonine protein kinase [Myxococcales bacterium]|nr:serine/threonine protein kinase [Myxococcales bacterium]MCB9543186.1 serine/threonine protein kinase [Myxococcales bacterium]
MRDQTVLTGRVLAGRYRIDRRIGAGGFAVVYQGVHLALGSAVAIKLITRPNPTLLARFRREARVHDRLNSRFIVRLRDFGEEADGVPFIIQDYIEGTNLRDLVTRDGPMAPGRAAELARQICVALDEAHLNGIVHRDIKPANVMLVETPRGEEIRLLDFGIAKVIDEDVRASAITQQGQIFGTIAYMAPEQIRGEAPTSATDLYAVGGLLYTLLTGEYPYQGTLESVAMQHLTAPLPVLPEGCPPEAGDIITRAMAKEPSARFPSAQAMADALAALRDRVKVWSALDADEETALDTELGEAALHLASIQLLSTAATLTLPADPDDSTEQPAIEPPLRDDPPGQPPATHPTWPLLAGVAVAALIGVGIAIPSLLWSPAPGEAERADSGKVVIPAQTVDAGPVIVTPVIVDAGPAAPVGVDDVGAREPSPTIPRPRPRPPTPKPLSDRDLLLAAQEAHRARDYGRAVSLYEQWLRRFEYSTPHPQYNTVQARLREARYQAEQKKATGR